jgi:membrane protease YdiL (CAAX protease family)
LTWAYSQPRLSVAWARQLQQATYVVGKCAQFALPVAFCLLVERRWPRWRRPRFAGLALGLAFGLAVAGGMLGLYYAEVRHWPALERAPNLVRGKLREFGITTGGGYLLFAAFLVVAHSLLEEYYWRWFVFGRLRRQIPEMAALVLSSLAFMAHHVLVLNVFLAGYFWTAVVPFSLAIAVGGAVWAWLYARTDSVWSSWLSHLLVDAAIFVVGWDLWQRAGG